MPAIEQLIPFGPLGGLDLVNNDRVASPTRARATRNVHKRLTDALKRRQGFKVASDNDGNSGGMGMFVYSNRDFDEGLVTPEPLMVGSRLYRLNTYSLTVAYAGSGQAVCEVLVNDGTWFFYLYVDSVAVLEYDMGVGYDEASPLTISDLKTAINAITDFTASSSGGDGSPCAFLPTTIAQLIDTSIAIEFQVSEEVNHPTGAADPFAGLSAKRNSDAFEVAGFLEVDDVLLIGTKWDTQKKFDGVTCYRAGVPQSGTPSAAGSGAGGLAAGTYQYAAIIVQVDAKQNRREGIVSLPTSVTTGGAQNINVTLSNVLAASGFNTDCGVVAGGQSGVTTITVDDGSGGSHTLKVGQTAYFYDGVSASYVERVITAVNATTITIAGANVNVADNAVISANLRIMLMRTAASGSIFRLHVELPNNSFTSTQVYNDGTADGSLGADFEDPANLGTEHGLPPVGGYLTMFNNVPVCSGDPENPDTFSWASEQGAEYWPGLYSDIVVGGRNFSITGLMTTDRFLWIHKQDETFQLVGNLLTAQYSLNKRDDGVGCVSNASIVQGDEIVLWLSTRGVYGTKAGSSPELVSYDISPLFRSLKVADELRCQFTKSVACWDRTNSNYILFIPAESDSSGEKYANSNSLTLVLDTSRMEWWTWDGLNMAGGATFHKDDFYFMERRFTDLTSDVVYNIRKRINTNTVYDYVDHVDDIPWSWEGAGSVTLEYPTTPKTFTHIVHWCLDSEKIAAFTLNTFTERDFVKGSYHSQLSTQINGGAGQGWGFSRWGFDGWGSPVANANLARRLKSGDAKALRFLFEASGIYQEMVLASFDLQITAPFRAKVGRTNENG